MKYRASIAAMFLLLMPSLVWGLDRAGLESRFSVSAPSGLSLEVRAMCGEQVFAVVGTHDGSPLAALRSIIVHYREEAPVRGSAAFVEGGVLGRYWTEPMWFENLSELPSETQYIVYRDDAGSWIVLIPLVGSGMRATFAGSEGGVDLVSESFHEGWGPTRVPLMVVAAGDDPYAVTRKAYTFAFEIMREIDPEGVIGRPRWEKPYPEVFEYIGWCSWNSHYRFVKADDLVEHARSFKQAGFPIRWVLIDDGWQSVNRNTYIPWAQGKLYMTAFSANDKFPGGLKPVVDTLKNDYGISWVGVWHTFQGYWNGIAVASALGRDYRDSLYAYSDEAAIPDPRGDEGTRFWSDWYEHLASQGIDFVKVDNQSTLPSLVSSILPVSRAMAQSQNNLQVPAEKYFNSQVINCMEMNIDVVYQWRTTNIARSSGDYIPISYHNPRVHTMKNVMNAMWISNLAYPDYDMLKTHDQHVDYHAVARAMSGGPAYITDNAGRERFEYLWPLIHSDGRLIRVDEPGLPARRTLLASPLRGRAPFLAFARSGAAGLLAAWNVDSFERPLSFDLSPQDVEGLEGEKFAVYDHMNGELVVVERDGIWPARLGRWGVKLFVVAPVADGFAPIGLAEKYVSPGTVVAFKVLCDRAVVALSETGTFVAYSEKKPALVKVNGEALPEDSLSWINGALKVKVPRATGEVVGLELIW